MADRLVREVALYLSTRPQPGLGVDEVVGANFLKMVTDVPAFVTPRVRFRNDAGRPGHGHEFATKQCAEVLEHDAITITGEVNSLYAGRLALRSKGGAVVDAQQGGSAAWKHTAKMLDALLTRQLPASTIVSILGGANYRLADMVVDRFRLEQTRNEVPRFSCDLIGSGKFTTPNGIDIQQVETATAAGTVSSGATPINVTITAAGMPGSPRLVPVTVVTSDTATVWAGKVRVALAADPIVNVFFLVSGTGTAIVLTARLAAANDGTMNIAIAANGTGITDAPTSTNTTAGAKALPATAITLPCFDGNLSEVFWTDQNGLQTLTGSGCTIMSFSIETANNTRLNDRCAGDPTVTITDGALTTTPSYVRKMKHMDRIVSAQIAILMDDTIPDWFTYATNDVLTDFTIRANGPIIASTFRHSLGEIMPKARITDLGPTEVEGEAALQMTLEPFWDDSSLTPIRTEVINTTTSAYD